MQEDGRIGVEERSAIVNENCLCEGENYAYEDGLGAGEKRKFSEPWGRQTVKKPVSVCRSRLLPPRLLAPPFLTRTPSATRILHAPTDLKTNNQNRIKSIKASSITGSNSNMILNS